LFPARLNSEIENLTIFLKKSDCDSSSSSSSSSSSIEAETECFWKWDVTEFEVVVRNLIPFLFHSFIILLIV